MGNDVKKATDKLNQDVGIGIVKVKDGYVLSISRKVLENLLKKMDDSNQDRALLQIVSEENVQ